MLKILCEIYVVQIIHEMGGKKGIPMNKYVVSMATTFTNTFGPLLWENFFHVKESQQASRQVYAVVIKKGDVVVGHLPLKVLCVCSLFWRSGSTIHCQVSGG